MQQKQTNNLGGLTYDELIDLGKVNNILLKHLLGSELEIKEMTMTLTNDDCSSCLPFMIVKHNDFEWLIAIEKRENYITKAN